ncbi:hypothetical protein AAHA92_32952 [Salvia divinorum]|uniref:Di19 zinc-binding domain-containing protein n=1 Tax=Salvia divinorum TaxID=28513 RepID=A0ABD1FMF8_SALDI
MICVHLQEEHCFALKNAVCPICQQTWVEMQLVILQRNMHIQSRKKSQKSGFWSNASSNIIRELRELSSFLGSNSPNNSGNSGKEPCHDPLAPFLCTVPLTVKDIQKEQPCVAATSDEERKADSCRPSTIFVRTLLPLPIPEALDDASLFKS